MKSYNGNNVFGVSFGLYGLDGISYEETKECMLRMVESYEEVIASKLDAIGLEYSGIEWYSPRYYNHSNDSVDIKIAVKNVQSYIAYLLENKEAIQRLLSKNIGYSGYIPLTVNTVEEEINRVVNGESPDIIPISYALRDIITEEDVYECYVFEEEENTD